MPMSQFLTAYQPPRRDARSSSSPPTVSTVANWLQTSVPCTVYICHKLVALVPGRGASINPYPFNFPWTSYVSRLNWSLCIQMQKISPESQRTVPLLIFCLPITSLQLLWKGRGLQFMLWFMIPFNPSSSTLVGLLTYVFIDPCILRACLGV